VGFVGCFQADGLEAPLEEAMLLASEGRRVHERAESEVAEED